MTKLVIMKDKTQCSDAIGYTEKDAHFYSWDAFTRNIKDPSWIGFSKREVNVTMLNDTFVMIECQNNIANDFLLALAESTSIDFEYSVL